MNWLTRWHLLERFWEPVRRQLFLARQLRTERDYWRECAEIAAEAAEGWKNRAEACEGEMALGMPGLQAWSPGEWY